MSDAVTEPEQVDESTEQGALPLTEAEVEAVVVEPVNADAEAAELVSAEGTSAEEAEAAEEVDAVAAVPLEPDAVLLASRNVARAALEEITDPKSIGADEGHEAHEQHVLTLYFACTLPGYPGWRWAATLARVDADSPVNVLEVELLPGEGAVVAPEWVQTK